MSLQFIFGGSGCGKSYYIQHFITKEAKLFPNRRYYYIVPEQFTMETQKELIDISDGKGILNIDVQSFVRLAFLIFGETGACNMPVLDDMGKTMILKKVLGNIQGELGYFRRNVRKKGYIQELKSFISELYQYDINEDRLDDMIAKSKKHPVLSRKLEDVKKIYSAFDEYLNTNYITNEELLTLLSKVVEQSSYLKDSVIVLDGFTGFTPNQYKLIEKLLLVSKKVYVTVAMDKNVPAFKVGKKHELFYMSQKTVNTLINIANKNDIEILQEIWTGQKIEETRFDEAEDIFHLEKNIFRYPYMIFNNKSQNISVHITSQAEDEMKFVATEVKKLIRDKRCKYSDIAVVTGDLETYGTLGRQIMDRAGIPVFIDQKKGIDEQPFVALIKNVLDMFLYGFDMDHVMMFEKNSFSHATLSQCDLLDNFLRATGIRGYKKWENVWDVKNIFSGISEAKLFEIEKEIDIVRLETVEQVEQLYEEIGRGKHTVLEYSKSICLWLIRERYYEKILQYAEKMKEQCMFEEEWQYRQIYQIVMDVFDRLVELLGDEEMTLKEYRELLDTGFSEARIGVIPPGVDNLVIGDMNRTRLAHIKYLFFVGMNDENIPKASEAGGVISEPERLFLSEEEFDMAPTLREKIYTEQFYLYLTFTKPSNHLYLSYCETGTDGKVKNPAYIINRIEKIYPDLTQVIEENRTDDSYILGNEGGVEYLIAGLRNKKFTDKKWQQILKYYLSNEMRKKKISPIIEAAFYREENTPLSREVVKKLYDEIMTGSTSQFEQYAACAFSYFMKYGLKISDRKEHAVAIFDIGNILHNALEKYTRMLIENNERWQDITEEEEIRREKLCINNVVDNYKEGLLFGTKRDEYLILRIEKILHRTVWAITKQMEQGKFSTVESEVAFELTEKMTDDKDDTIRLIGRIDRIDTATDDDNTYVKIIDYKTGEKDMSLSDLYYGLQMQLVIYLKASINKFSKKEKKIVVPAGILYYMVDDPIVEATKDSDIDELIIKNLKLDGLVNEDDPVIPYMDENMGNDMGLLPNISSNIIPVSTNKNAELKSNSKTIVTKDFVNIIEFATDKINEIHRKIMAGDISISPYRRGEDTDKTACKYCSYRGICRFDPRIKGNNYNMINKLSDDDVLRKISERGDDSDE